MYLNMTGQSHNKTSYTQYSPGRHTAPTRGSRQTWFLAAEHKKATKTANSYTKGVLSKNARPKPPANKLAQEPKEVLCGQDSFAPRRQLSPTGHNSTSQTSAHKDRLGQDCLTTHKNTHNSMTEIYIIHQPITCGDPFRT